jgi:hypothetical protein
VVVCETSSRSSRLSRTSKKKRENRFENKFLKGRNSTMKKKNFQENGIHYTQVGDYFLPDLRLPEAEKRPIGVWGERHRRYLKEHHRVCYYNLLTSAKLDACLADIEEQAETLFLRLVEELAEKEGVTERLKADDPASWVRQMNNIFQRVREIVNAEMIYI